MGGGRSQALFGQSFGDVLGQRGELRGLGEVEAAGGGQVAFPEAGGGHGARAARGLHHDVRPVVDSRLGLVPEQQPVALDLGLGLVFEVQPHALDAHMTAAWPMMDVV